MIFAKKDLEFLKLYDSCTDNSQTGKNFQLKKVRDDTLRFSQVTNDVYLFTDLVQPMKNIEDNYCCNFPTAQVVQLLNTCGDKDTIFIEKNSIKFGGNSSYKFDQITLNVDSQEKVLDNISNGTHKAVPIKDLEKINEIKFFIGSEKGLNFVPLMNNYFVATDRYDFGFIKTTNNISENISLSKIMVDIFNSLKLKEITIIEEDDKSFFKHNNTTIIFPKQNSLIPNFFEDKWKSYYEFADKVIVNKNDLIFALDRISIFARDNVNSRIFITFNDKEIKIESKDKGYAEEIVPAEIDKSLVGYYLILSSNTLLNTISLIENDKIEIQVKPNKDAICLSIWDKNKERFFINNILPYID